MTDKRREAVEAMATRLFPFIDQEFLTDRAVKGEAVRAAESALTALESLGWQHVPDDCVVVPREASPEMCAAFEAAYIKAPPGSGVALAWEAGWDAMLRAAKGEET